MCLSLLLKLMLLSVCLLWCGLAIRLLCGLPIRLLLRRLSLAVCLLCIADLLRCSLLGARLLGGE